MSPVHRPELRDWVIVLLAIIGAVDVVASLIRALRNAFG